MNPSRFSMYPLLWLALSFGFGIAAASLSGLDWRVALVLSTVFAAIAFTVREKQYGSIAVIAAFFFLGAFCYQFEIVSIRDDRIKRIYDEGRILSGSPVEIEGVMIGLPEPAFDGVFVRLAAEKIFRKEESQKATGVVRLFLPLSEPEQISDLRSLDLRSGTRVRIACELLREDQFLNPGVMPRRSLLDQQGIDATGTIKSPLLIEVIGRAGWASPVDLVYEQRQWLIDEFRSRFAPSTAGVMVASLLGDKYFLDKDTADVFREGGTFHVLVISGLHITFIGGILFWIVSRFTKNRMAQFVIVCSVLWLYTLAVGAEVPVVRASIMFTALLLSRVIYRTGTLLNTLGLCCLILLAWRPADLFNPSFQLTVVSVAAIVGMAFPVIEKLRPIGAWMPDASNPFPPNVPKWLKRFCEMLYWREIAWEIERERQIWSGRIFKSPTLGARLTDSIQKLVAILFEGVVVSVIVQLWMLPLLIYYFHRVSPISIILNLWVGFIIAIESFAALIAVFFGQFSNALSYPFSAITNVLNWLLVAVPRVFVMFDWASFRVPIYSGPMKAIYLLYALPIVILSIAIYRWDPFSLRKLEMKWMVTAAVSGFAAACLALVMIFHPFSSPRPDGRLHVEFLDVGQGDSAFITFPNGETMLMDGGGRVSYRNADDDVETFEPDQPRIGEMVVSEFLWEKGYSRIDHVVVTHADADHSQGLADVVRSFRVGTIYLGALPGGDSELDELMNEARRSGVPLRQIGRGENFEIGGVRIETLWPVKSSQQTGSDNNSSLVMRFVFGETVFLFTGDIEKEAEAEILAKGTVLSAHVIKVPHHGSRTSSTAAFIDSVGAGIAVIPVGRRSMFGHPHKEVVERWRNAGADVMRTGEKGIISFSTDGKRIVKMTYLE